MKKTSLVVLLFVALCGGSDETVSKSIDEITSTTEFLGVQTTTTLIEPITTIAGKEMQELNIEITNCPVGIVDIEIGESFEINFFVQAGSADVISIFYYFELNGEYYSRLPLDKENHSEFFDFPTISKKTESGTFVEKLNEGDTYTVYIDVIDDDSNSKSTECVVKF